MSGSVSYIAEAIGPDGFGAYFVDWSSGAPEFAKVSLAADMILVPGFIDIHIHGAYGMDFMSATADDLIALADKLGNCGYEGFLPTTVAASAREVSSAIESLPDHPMILGFHLEGPFISPEFPGAQPQQSIIDPPLIESEWDYILDHPKLRIVTLAPERPNALALIARLQKRGVIVSIGHSDATYDEARFGYEFGATHITHTFNAMRRFHHREAGVTGYAFKNPALECELIYDRIHVCKESADILLRFKGQESVIAVSDSSAATGLAKGTNLEMWGQQVETGTKCVYLAGTLTLAGSGITLLDSFQNLAEDFGIETATRLCSINPRRALGITSMPRVYCEFDRKLKLVGIRRIES
jgi:N-acetylglucosamine-6-phosphate deacetylase